MVEAVSIGVHAASRAQVELGQTVVVIGAGIVALINLVLRVVFTSQPISK